MKNYLIVGAGRSGIAAGKMLTQLGENFTIYDAKCDLDTKSIACQISDSTDIILFLVPFSLYKSLNSGNLFKTVTVFSDTILSSNTNLKIHVGYWLPLLSFLELLCCSLNFLFHWSL